MDDVLTALEDLEFAEILPALKESLEGSTQQRFSCCRINVRVIIPTTVLQFSRLRTRRRAKSGLSSRRGGN